jgi:uncharacterized protein (DUF3820 family)
MARYYQIKPTSSSTLVAVLGFVYRKKELLSQCGGYSDRVIKGLIQLGLLKKVSNKRDTYFFTTAKSKSYKAIDLAKEFLWKFHNPDFNQIKDGKKLILCFDSSLDGGKGLVEIGEAIKKNYV